MISDHGVERNSGQIAEARHKEAIREAGDLHVAEEHERHRSPLVGLLKGPWNNMRAVIAGVASDRQPDYAGVWMVGQMVRVLEGRATFGATYAAGPAALASTGAQ